jgi:hypothetical protein
MKSAEQYAREALVQVVARQHWANPDAAVDALVPFFKRAMSESAYFAERAERERLPDNLRKVLQSAYDVVFGILKTKPSAEKCVEELLKISPSLHAALHPSMHG